MSNYDAYGKWAMLYYEYIWDKDGKKIGDSVFSIKKTDKSNYIMKATGIENTVVEVKGSNLTPLRANRMLGKDSSISATFSDKKAHVKAKLPAGLQEATIDVPPVIFHNDSLLLSLMSMDMKDHKTITFKHYNPSNSVVADFTISVVGQEKVTVPAGTFDTYHLKLDYLDGKVIQNAWYDKSTPHKLIKYTNNPSGTTAKLVK